MKGLISALTFHYADGFSMAEALSLEEKEALIKDQQPSPIVKVTWLCNSNLFQFNAQVGQLISVCTLPDSTGLIVFEHTRKPDNCLLLDAYGKERMRLSVPWYLTRPNNPESNQPPSNFFHPDKGYPNPVDGKPGQFGLIAWVEYAGRYYFELDYHTGQFLWGREIWD
jgi:hypothetical protein